MALIRNQQAAKLAEDAIVLDLGDLRRQGEQMKAAAKAQADQIIAEAREEARRLTDGAEQAGREIGYAAGHAEGLVAGRKEGHAEALAKSEAALAKLQEAWVNAAHQWDAERREMVAEARQSLLTLAVRMAEKIVRRVPRVEPSIVQDQVAEALSHVTGPCDARVAIHPDDRPLVEEALPGVVDQLGQVRHVTLLDDASVGRGGCIVRYGTGRIDATLDTQLRRLIETLLPDAEVRAEGEVDEPTQPHGKAEASSSDEAATGGEGSGGAHADDASGPDETGEEPR